MKKIFFSIVALAALAACTKSEVAYEQTSEIGFMAVAGNMTKAPVSGNVFPEALHLYVNAYVHQTDASKVPTAPDYISNGEFAHRDGTIWAGLTPYYWPNEQTLHFSGFSKSGNATNANASYNPTTDVLTITDYTPTNATGEGANDLMWFPSTKYEETSGYGKRADAVPVDLYHTCSWITFMIQGDATTGISTSTYKITSLKMNGLDLTADVECTGDEDLAQNNLSAYVAWSENTTQTESYNVTVPAGGVSLASTYTSESSKTPKNLETNAITTTGGNIVVIPQKPCSIDLAWTYESNTGNDIPDSATGLSLKLNNDNSLNWEPGKHYVYTITIKANEILIAPAPVDWVDGGNKDVTVE